MLGVDGMAVSGWSHLGKGVIAFDEAPAEGAVLTAGFRFDVPVCFAEDRPDVRRPTLAAGEAPSAPHNELRDAWACRSGGRNWWGRAAACGCPGAMGRAGGRR